MEQEYMKVFLALSEAQRYVVEARITEAEIDVLQKLTDAPDALNSLRDIPALSWHVCADHEHHERCPESKQSVEGSEIELPEQP
jgi:predicted RNA-binding Zn ribbon-like protein